MTTKAEAFVEKVAWIVILMYLAMLFGIQFEKWNARREERLAKKLDVMEARR